MLLIEINGKHCILWQTTVIYWLSISPNPCCFCKLKWQIHNLCSMCFVSADYWKIVLYSSILHEPALQRPLCTVWIPSSHSCTAFYKLSPKCCSKFSSICVDLLFQLYVYMLNPLKTQLSFRNIWQNIWLYSMCLTACVLQLYSHCAPALFACIPNCSQPGIPMLNWLSNDREVLTLSFPSIPKRVTCAKLVRHNVCNLLAKTIQNIDVLTCSASNHRFTIEIRPWTSPCFTSNRRHRLALDTVCAGVVGTAIWHSTSCASRGAAACGRISGQLIFYEDQNFTKSKGNLSFRRLVPLFVPIDVCVTMHDDGTASDVTIGMWRHNQQATAHERNGKPWFSFPT